MKTKRLSEALERVEQWPTEWQDELAQIALDMDAGLEGGVYHPTPAELEGIDRGLRDAEQGRFASDEKVDAILAKLRGASTAGGTTSLPRGRRAGGTSAAAVRFIPMSNHDPLPLAAGDPRKPGDPPMRDKPEPPIQDPPADPSKEPDQPFGDPTPIPGNDPPDPPLET